MSLLIVAAIRRTYPTPLGARHLEFLEAVARATSLGLVQKNSGTFLSHPTAGGVSQDVLMECGGAAVDCLIDAEGAANPAWNPIAPIDPSRYVAVSTGQPPIPPAPPEPQPDPDWALLVAALKGVGEGLEALEAQSSAIQERLDTQAGILTRLVELVLEPQPAPVITFPTYAGRIFGFGITLKPEPPK